MSTYRDLRPVADSCSWDAMVVRAGTDPLARTALRLREHADELIDEAVRRIGERVPGYASADPVPRDDLRTSVHRNLELILLLLGERRGPTPAELAARAALGVRRAEAGLGVTDLLRAFRVGYLVLWEGLTARARSLDAEAVESLLESAARIWSLQDQVCEAVEQAHRERADQLDLDGRRHGTALLRALHALPVPEARDEAEQAARALRLDPEGPFLVAVVCGGTGGQGHRPLLPRTVAVSESDRTVLVSQPVRDPDPEASLATALARLGWQHVGIGLPGQGLLGARRSLAEAERLVRAGRATGRGLLRWSEDWFACLAHETADHLEPLVGTAVDALRRSPDLARTVEAVLDAGGNVTAAAGGLFLHPNTVSYRVKRLAETTGIDLRQGEGALLARAALLLSGRLSD